MKQQLSSFFVRIQAAYKTNPWKGRFILMLIFIIILVGIVRVTLPHTIIYGATTWLKQQGIISTIEDIDIDILNGSFSLVNATGSESGKPLFNVGRIDIHWHWAPLSEKTVVITKVALDHFTVNIEQYADEILIGGVHIPLAASTTETPVDKKADKIIKPWAASLNEVIFSQLNICYLQHTTPHDQSNDESKYVDYCIDLAEMTWGGAISYATDAELLKTDDLALSSTGNFALNGLTITDNKVGRKLFVSTSNTLNNVVISGLRNIHIDSLEMNGLSALQRDDETHKDAVRFHRLAINDISLINLNSLSINNINITEPGFYLVKDNEQHWEHQQWLPQTITTNPVPDNTSNDSPGKPAASFNISINNITIEKIDACHLQKNNDLYYCLVFTELAWQGNIKYGTLPSPSGDINLTLTGDLKLSRPNVYNKTIDRSLVSFSELALKNLNLSALDAITLDSLILNTFAALQRSTKLEDNTVSFESLAINNISYSTDKIAVDTIKLDGLSETVSKNPDGSWEHNKWLSPVDKTSKIDDANKPDKTSTRATTVSLKELLINSDKEFLYIDNSTKPTMQLGLQSLSLAIKNLDSTRPDKDSPIHLAATTIRHSTIKIDGTARPLAEKISFNLDGELKGFDLRNASPAVNKATGHIIKSGQLDADLKLLATEGQLDSKVALSLYQFHIKAKSKEDAAKLDASLGMPLNQTLVLLRDKDDSIHLTIPITGDISKPNFNPMDAIVKATTKAATVTLITFYTPYGLIYAGGNVLFDLATAMNFDPIAFAAGSAEISGDNKHQLENLSKLLTEKPGIRLTLCGATNQQDAFVLYPELKKQQNDKNKEQITLSSKQVTALNQLAKQRQINTKNLLITENNISHDRLILCEPEYKTNEDAIAGVEINI